MEAVDPVAICSRPQRLTAKPSLPVVPLGTASAQRAEAHTRVDLTRPTIELRWRQHEMIVHSRSRARRFVAAALTAVGLTGGSWVGAQSLAAPELKAAFLFNFAQFMEWPAETVPAGTTVALCIVNDDAVADALEQTVKGRTVEGHSLSVKRLKAGAPLPPCHVLYVAGSDLKRSLDAIETVKGVFVLTVSDAARFAETGGMVELFVEGDRMRFAVNVDALQRAGVRLSSRVLGLAKIVKDAKLP
jgi:uncharacterized protein DUF4154